MKKLFTIAVAALVLTSSLAGAGANTMQHNAIVPRASYYTQPAAPDVQAAYDGMVLDTDASATNYVGSDITPIPEDEAAQIRKFLSIKNKAGVSNGEQIANRVGMTYDPYDCTTWKLCFGFDGTNTGHITGISILDANKIDLVGELCIDNMPYLDHINIEGNHLTKFSVNNCPSLATVICEYSKESMSITFYNTPNITQLWVSGSKCYELDVSDMPKLEDLHAASCGLTYIDVSHNPKMRNLYLMANPLYDITFGDNSYLSVVEVSHARFPQGITYENMPNLAFVVAANFDVGTMNIANCPEVVSLLVRESNIRRITFDSLERLSVVELDGNPDLNEFDTSNLRSITQFYAKNTSLHELDFSNSPILSYLRINNSKVERLQFHSDASYLYELECPNNNLSDLDLSTATYLYGIDCRNNSISKLEFNSTQKNFAVMYANGNPLKSLTRVPFSVGSDAEDFGTFDMYSRGLGHVDYTGMHLTAVPAEGSEFIGWYNKDGSIISSDKKIIIFRGEFAAKSYYEARFTGYEDETPEIPEPYIRPAIPYNEDEVAILREFFLNVAEESGRTNADRLNSVNNIFNIDNPYTWWCCNFNADGHLTRFITGGPDAGASMVGDLNLSGFPELYEVRINNTVLPSQFAPFEYPGLSSLDVSDCPKLTYVRVAHNMPLTTVNLSGCPSLETFSALGCKRLETLNTTECPKLAHLTITDATALNKLDMSNNAELEYIYAANTSLTSFDFSHNPALEYIDVSGNNLGKLIIPENDSLVGLACVGCNLPTLDLSGCKNLTRLLVSDNPFTTELDLSPLKSLSELQCDNCNLSSLDISRNNKLETLMCDGNALTTLNLQNNQALRVLSCADNDIATLDLSVLNTSNLHNCNTTGNPLTTITGAKRASGYGEDSFDVIVLGKGYASVLGRNIVAETADDEHVFIGWYDENGELVSRDAKCVIPKSGTKFEARFIVPELGDCNMDGTVNTGDAVLVLRSCVDLVALSKRQTALADMNKDGNINTGDAVVILKWTVGLE